MKTDRQLQKDVVAELAWDPAVRSHTLGVDAKDGVVTVNGQVATYAERRAIEQALRRVGGVQAIALELTVRPPQPLRRTDVEIAQAIDDALRWNSVVPPGQVHARVRDGRVTLEGEVDWNYQRQSVEQAVCPLIGVIAIDDAITLRPCRAAVDAARDVKAALQRQAVVEVPAIRVATDDGTITLRGEVRSWTERDAAGAAAWSAPGVRAVVDALSLAH